MPKKSALTPETLIAGLTAIHDNPAKAIGKNRSLMETLVDTQTLKQILIDAGLNTETALNVAEHVRSNQLQLLEDLRSVLDQAEGPSSTQTEISPLKGTIATASEIHQAEHTIAHPEAAPHSLEEVPSLGLLTLSRDLPDWETAKNRVLSRKASIDDLFVLVKETLVDALGVDDEEVTPTATLIADLGAESIDFLDIIFRIEKNTNVRIPRGELFPENLALADKELIKDGIVTPEGIKVLRQRIPHSSYELGKFEEDPRVENINELFTVQMVVRFLERKFNAEKKK